MKLEESFFNNISDFFLTRRDNYGEIYAIGGYLRDKFLRKFNKDLDFVVKKNSIKAAREVADYFGGDFYMLDKERETARALIPLGNQQLIVDVALINGENIYEDLKKGILRLMVWPSTLSNQIRSLIPWEDKRTFSLKN